MPDATGIDELVRSVVDRLGNLEAAYLVGDYARGIDTGIIDVVLVGDIDKVQLDDFVDGKVDAVYLATSRFVNTMKQDPSFIRLLPLPSGLEDPFQTGSQDEAALESQYGWDYLYEPDSQTVIDELLLRYVEGLVYQAVAENMASEQSARMVAMKAASDNAKKVIGDLQLVYNKTRQAAISKEISEIVGGAGAV